MKKWLFVGVIFSLLTACQPVTTTLPNANAKPNDSFVKPESPDPIIGDYVVAGPLSYVVTDVQQQKSITINGIDYKAKQAYLCVSISINNRSSQTIIAQPEMFQLADDKGNKYSPDVKLDLLVNNKGQGFFHQPLHPLQKTNAMLLFDTNLGIGQASIELSGGPLTLKKAYIRLLK